MRDYDKVNATDDPTLARLNGLTEWDVERGQFVAPAPAAEAVEETVATLPPVKATAKASKSTKNA